MNAVKRAAFATLALFLALSSSHSAYASTNHQTQGIVHWVIDGDTFQLETGERIRLIGINTPEYLPWKHRADFYGKEAYHYSKNLLTNKEIHLEKDVVEKDKYGRTLAYAYLGTGQLVNLLLVREGYAKARSYPPNTRYHKMLKNAEREARALQKGLWNRKAKAVPK